MDNSEVMPVSDENCKSVLLFGKTGNGKSTIANMLVAGNLKDPEFPMGDSMEGVTGQVNVKGGNRKWVVTDTIGLGEDTSTTRKTTDAVDLIVEWLKKYSHQYDHIVYVTRRGRADELDEEIWGMFLKVFQDKDVRDDVHHGIRVVITDASEKWINDNRRVLDKKFEAARGRYVHVDFPPMQIDDDGSGDPEAAQLRKLTEDLNSKKREESLQRLENNLHRWQQLDQGRKFTPHYSKYSMGEYVEFGNKVVRWIDELLKRRWGKAIYKATKKGKHAVTDARDWLKQAFGKSGSSSI